MRVRHRQRLLLVVRHVDERDADVLLDALELDLELLAQLEVERAQRLVEQQHRRAGSRARARAPRAAAGRRRAGAACASPRARGRRARAPRRPAGAPRPSTRAGARARRRRCARRSGAGTARSSGRPCWSGAGTGGWPVTSSPSSSTVPSLGSSKPAIMRSVVVLPQPDGPSIVKNWPLRDVEVHAAHGGEVAEALGDRAQADARRSTPLGPPGSCCVRKLWPNRRHRKVRNAENTHP